MFELHGPDEYQEMAYGQEDILSFVTGFLPDLERGHPDFRAAAVLVASLVECGPDERAIADLLEYDESWVRSVGQRFRERDIWRPEGVAVDGGRGSARILGREWWRSFTAGTRTSRDERGPDVIRWPKRPGERSSSRRSGHR
jgi:hypothetical protein